MSVNEPQLAEELVHYAKRLHQNGWVANHDGNVSVRLQNGQYLMTPTAVSKAVVEKSWLVVVNEKADVVRGSRKVFSEVNLHLYFYKRRQDVRAVIHSHSPYATALSVTRQPIRTTMMAEPVVSLGATIPLIPYAHPKDPNTTLALEPFVDDSDVFLLGNHGLLSVGCDLETAYLRMELAEHLAKIQTIAVQSGVVHDLPADDIERLLQARTQAGLGAAGRAQTRSFKGAQKALGDPVAKIVAEEIAAALARN